MQRTEQDNHGFIEISNKELTPEQKLLEFGRSLPIYGEYENALFAKLFPPDEIAPVEFNPDSLEIKNDLNHKQKNLRRAILSYFGYESPGKIDPTQVDSASFEPLHVVFSTREDTLTAMLNNLNIWNTDGIAQTDPRITMQRLENNETVFTRGAHAKHIGRMVAQTVLRLAILDSDLFLKKIQEDSSFYKEKLKEFHADKNISQSIRGIEKSVKNGSFPNKSSVNIFEPDTKSIELLESCISENAISLTKRQQYAIGVAIEYIKYLAIYAKAHDGETPAFGDIPMKTHGDGLRQKSADYNENDILADTIFDKIYITSSGLAGIIRKYNIDPLILGTMIRTASLGQDTGLMGMLMKDKGKKALGKGFDHDQLSGMTGGLFELAEKRLPGGLDHKARSQKDPIMSFQARLELLMRMEASDTPKEALIAFCRKNNIDPEQIYIGEEEVSIGRHLRLARNEDGEIVTVITNLGVAKHSMFASNVLEAFYYKSAQRAATEKFMQTMIACGLYGDDQGQNPFSEYMFSYKTDAELESILRRTASIIPYTLYELQPQATILSKIELEELAFHGNGKIVDCIIRPANIEIVQPRRATYGKTEDEEVLPLHEIINQTREHRTTSHDIFNPYSVPQKLTNLEDMFKKNEYFYCIYMTPQQQRKIQRCINSHPNTKEAMQRAFNFWRQDLQVGTQKISTFLSALDFLDTRADEPIS